MYCFMHKNKILNVYPNCKERYFIYLHLLSTSISLQDLSNNEEICILVIPVRYYFVISVSISGSILYLMS